MFLPQNSALAKHSLRDDHLRLSQGRPLTDTSHGGFINSLYLPRLLDCLAWRHTSECHQWLFFNETFQYWLQGADDPTCSRILWVAGAPCSGKTTAISGAYHKLLEHQDVLDGRHQVVAYFFQKAEELNLRDPDAMYRAILCQLLSTESEVTREVLEPYRELNIHGLVRNSERGELRSRRHLKLQDDCRRGLFNALKIICNRLRRVTIFLDALDELSGAEVSDHNLSQLDEFLYELTNSDEFRDLRLCLSIRSFGSLRWNWLDTPRASQPGHLVEEKRSLSIEVQFENNQAIRTYVDGRLQRYIRDTKALVAIKDQIEEASQGIFLWVESMVDRLRASLRHGQADQLSIRPEPIPTGLKKAYREILLAADERLKTWRLFQWMFLAPDLGLNGWRDLLPFLQDKPPWSLKRSRGRKSKDWAKSPDSTSGSDEWVSELSRVICRLSLGLAHVTTLPKTSLESPINDYHSAAGEAGSWVTADGDKWVVCAVHHSLRQFLQDENGFGILDPRVKDHRSDGLTTAMMTCLDFINVREFSGLNVFSTTRSVPNSQKSGDSLFSDGDASARTSISEGSASSARSIEHPRRGLHLLSLKGSFFNVERSHSSGQTVTDNSTAVSSEQLDTHETDIRVAVLAHLKQETVRRPVTTRDNRMRIKDWIQSLEGVFDDPNPAKSPTLENSSQVAELGPWSSELLAYVMTAFPRFAQAAEGARVDPTPVILRLREDGLWARLRCLCEATGEGTSLKQWAESLALQTWVDHLARNRVNPYTCPTPYKPPDDRGDKWLSNSRCAVDMNLKYCLDGGTSSVIGLEGQKIRVPFLSTIWNDLEHRLEQMELERRLEGELWGAMVENNEPVTMRFIPYRSLRRILTDDAWPALLRRRALNPQKTHGLRDNYIRVLALLLLMGNVAHMKQLLEQEINDACLPIKVKSQDPKCLEAVIVESQVPGKGNFVIKGLEYRQWCQFEKLQWTVLSPFLAKLARHTQHYKLLSEKQPLPIVEHQGLRRSGGDFGFESLEEVRLHSESYDFGMNTVRKKPPHDSIITPMLITSFVRHKILLNTLAHIRYGV